jgi:membrane associated rhomboid family serine protease
MSVTEQNKKNRILLGQDNNALTWLIIINAVVFVSLLFIKVAYQMSNGGDLLSFQTQIADWFALPAGAHNFLSRPWTIVSYMFSHDSIWYFISTLLWLWCFGYILQDLAGNNKLFPVYFYGGVIGAIAFLISASLIPVLHQQAQPVSMMGAGTSIVAIAVATTVLAPNYRIFPMINGGIPLWMLTLVFIAVDFGTIGITNSAVAIAHIAGGFTGFLFVNQLKRGTDWGAWMVYFSNWLNNLFNPGKKNPEENQTFYKATRKPYEKTHHVTQQKLDEILDKINQQGYHFLTDEEKEFLKKASQEDF